MKVNLTIIIQRIMHALDSAFDKSNVCGSLSNANVLDTYSNVNAFKMSLRHLYAHSNAEHSNTHSNVFAFVNKHGSNTTSVSL